MKRRPVTHRLPMRPATRQRGVVLLFSLIALVVMLIAAVAMIRSFHTSLFMAGNIGFKRDMRNQSELAASKALAYFRDATKLGTSANRANANTQWNYSARILSTDAQGIPDALQDANFATYGIPNNDIQSADGSVTVRYVIDRLCAGTGDETTLGAASCVLANNPTPPGGGLLNLKSSDKAPLCPTCTSAAPQGVIYRLSVRVIGPRKTMSFFQSTFTVPS